MRDDIIDDQKRLLKYNNINNRNSAASNSLSKVQDLD